MRKPVKAAQLYVMPSTSSPDPNEPQPIGVKRKTGCAPQFEAVKARIYRQWKEQGVSMRSLAVIYRTTKDEIERVLQERAAWEGGRRAA